MSERQLSLNLFIYPNGHHEAAWRHPQSVPQSSMDIGYYQQLALALNARSLMRFSSLIRRHWPKAGVKVCAFVSNPLPGWRELLR